jgi:hypothetical protein
MTKKFKVEMYVTWESEEYPEDKAQDFVESLFRDYEYRSIITTLKVTDLEVTDIANL